MIKDEIITGVKMQQTIDELKLEAGNIIYFEMLNVDNTWPTEKAKEKLEKARQYHSYGQSRRTVGLYNLGNTCYMNAAL